MANREQVIETCKRCLAMMDSSIPIEYRPVPKREFYVSVLAALQNKTPKVKK